MSTLLQNKLADWLEKQAIDRSRLVPKKVPIHLQTGRTIEGIRWINPDAESTNELTDLASKANTLKYDKGDRDAEDTIMDWAEKNNVNPEKMIQAWTLITSTWGKGDPKATQGGKEYVAIRSAAYSLLNIDGYQDEKKYFVETRKVQEKIFNKEWELGKSIAKYFIPLYIISQKALNKSMAPDKTITVYRGVGGKFAVDIINSIERGEKEFEIPNSGISSWALNRETASMYASSSGFPQEKARNGVVLSKKILVKDIFLYPEGIYKHSSSEPDEVLVFGAAVNKFSKDEISQELTW
ncbi:hypothetical protein HYS94_01865 [Candidatus Daviesbacteria bacterium]|nr:hypothetical protein [Candidatus Daviesbacteria bacterium]